MRSLTVLHFVLLISTEKKCEGTGKRGILLLFILVFFYLAGGAAADIRTGKLPNRYLIFWMVIL